MGDTAALVLWTLFYLATPALILYLAYTIDHISKLGTIVVAYALGLLIGNLGLLPDNIDSVHSILTTITVPVALPLIFFSVDLRSWRHQAKTSTLSLFAGLLSIIAASFAAFLIFAPFIGNESWKAGGMLVGVYTGGTPNLAAIGNALGVDPLTYVSVHGSDVVASAVIFLFLITAAPKLFSRVLPAFSSEIRSGDEHHGFSPYFTGASKKELAEMGLSLLLALVIFAAGGSFTLFLPETAALPAAILLITSLGIAASFVPSVRKLRNSFQLGYYLILVFSLCVSSMANVRSLSLEAPIILLYVAVLLIMVSIFHLLFSKLFKIDVDTHIITSTSFIFSPPFVPVVAAALNNRKVVVPGILIGVTGWVLGNYLGIGIAYILRGLG